MSVSGLRREPTMSHELRTTSDELQTSPAAGVAEGWFDGPMRWVQLTLVENDPGNFDPAFWLDYFKALHADAATLSAGGIVAYYPTEVPLHHRSAWLGTSDPFGTLLAGCRALGMRVVARTDPHAARDEVKAAHPDWIAVTADGEPRRHWANHEMWVTCALGPYNFEFMDQVHREIVTRYRVDGIFSNRWAPQGDCYCVHCQKNFRDATGLDLPRTTNPRDPARRRYLEWRTARLVQALDALGPHGARRESRRAVHSEWTTGHEIRRRSGGDSVRRLSGAPWPDAAVGQRPARQGVPIGDGTPSDRRHLQRGCRGALPLEGLGAERSRDSALGGRRHREWHAAMGRRSSPACCTTAAGWLPSSASTSGTSSTNGICETRPHSREWPCSYSEQTATYHTGVGEGDRPDDHVLGMYQALIEARVPFELVHEARLTADRLDAYKLLILADAAALTDAQCDAIRAYVARGGSVLATFASSLYTDQGERRTDFGLADLFGVSFAGRIDGPMQNSYLSLDADPAGRRHAILDGFGDTSRIINGVFRVDVRPTAAFPSPVTLVPTYPDLPMEDVYPRVPHTDTREIYLREIGASRVAYVPWDIDRTFWEVLSIDHGRLLRNLDRVDGERAPPVEVEGPGVLDVTFWRQRESVAVHLVNLTNPMMMKGPVREILPIGPQHVRVRMPRGLHPKQVRLLTAGTQPEFEVMNGAVSMTVPSIDVHEVIAIDT